MIKLSINLEKNPQTHELVRPEYLAEISSGCMRVLDGLGSLASLVEVFRVTWVNLDDKGFGPAITVYFHDPMGQKGSHSTDFRFMGRKTPAPTADEISSCVLEHLAQIMNDQILMSKPKFAEAKMAYEALGGAAGKPKFVARCND